LFSFFIGFCVYKILDVICDFLKYIVFLNIFYIVYIYIYILKNSMALASIFGEYIFRALASLSFDES